MSSPRPDRMLHAALPGLIVLLAALSAGARADTPPGQAADAPQPVAARWESRKLDYTYSGFTTHYSCDGFEDRIRSLLLALGARHKDLKIRSTGCIGGPRPSSFPHVEGTYSVLVPVDPAQAAGTGDTATPPVQARWQRVDVTRNPGLGIDQGECELLEQFQRSILPAFTTRNVDASFTCIPHQVMTGGARLKVDVLKAVPKEKPAG